MNLNDEVKEMLKYAGRIAAYYGADHIRPVHALFATVSCPNTRIIRIMANHLITEDRLARIYRETDQEFELESHPWEGEYCSVMNEILKEMPPFGSITLLLRKILIQSLDVQNLLACADVDLDKLIDDLKKSSEDLIFPTTPFAAKPPPKAKPKESATPFLDLYCKNLTKMAADGLIDPVIGRKREIQRVIQILGRRRKNNPVILGPAGVGKSALVEGLALSIDKKEAHCVKLHDKTLVCIDLSLMIAGTKYRGMFEERLTGVINELEANPDIIAFCDELHTLVGAGDCEGGNDAANMIKPTLARGLTQIIGATTLNEYNIIKADAALARRFQPVVLEDLERQDVLDILKGIKSLYEDHHGVKYSKAALERIVDLGSEIEGRHAPDAQIDLLDEVGAATTKKRINVQEVERVYELQQGASQNKTKRVGFGS